MNIILYKFSKKDNSTARPTGGTTYSCRLKEDCSILNPIIDIVTPAGVTWPDYNMAYISDFGRYYRINDIVASTGLWTISMQTDVLATYKTEIGNSSLYVLRSASAYNGNLIDEYYPVTAQITKNYSETISPWINLNQEYIDLASGCFVLGIVSNNNPGDGAANATFGSITYRAFTRDNLEELVHYLLGTAVSDGVNGFSAADCSIALQKAMIDPLSFIKSAIWIPVSYASISIAVPDTDTPIWTFTAPGVESKLLTKGNPYFMGTVNMTLTKHPQAASRGLWLNLEPYTKISMLFPPFGLLDLDTSLLASETSVQAIWNVDYITGLGTVTIRAGTIATKYIKSQVGVPIQLSQVTHDILSGAAGVVGGVGAAIAGLFTFNAAAVLGGMAAAVGSGIGAARPHESTIGGSGSFSELHGKVKLYEEFRHVANENNAEVGRPLCETRTINTLSGYIKAVGDVSISGTSGEQAEVKAFIEGGFFYE